MRWDMLIVIFIIFPVSIYMVFCKPMMEKN